MGVVLIDTLSRLGLGLYPPQLVVNRGGPFCPLLGRGPVRHKNVLEKNKRGCACSAWAAGV